MAGRVLSAQDFVRFTQVDTPMLRDSLRRWDMLYEHYGAEVCERRLNAFALVYGHEMDTRASIDLCLSDRYTACVNFSAPDGIIRHVCDFLPIVIGSRLDRKIRAKYWAECESEKGVGSKSDLRKQGLIVQNKNLYHFTVTMATNPKVAHIYRKSNKLHKVDSRVYYYDKNFRGNMFCFKQSIVVIPCASCLDVKRRQSGQCDGRVRCLLVEEFQLRNCFKQDYLLLRRFCLSDSHVAIVPILLKFVQQHEKQQHGDAKTNDIVDNFTLPTATPANLEQMLHLLGDCATMFAQLSYVSKSNESSFHNDLRAFVVQLSPEIEVVPRIDRIHVRATNDLEFDNLLFCDCDHGSIRKSFEASFVSSARVETDEMESPVVQETKITETLDSHSHSTDEPLLSDVTQSFQAQSEEKSFTLDESVSSITAVDSACATQRLAHKCNSAIIESASGKQYYTECNSDTFLAEQNSPSYDDVQQINDNKINNSLLSSTTNFKPATESTQKISQAEKVCRNKMLTLVDNVHEFRKISASCFGTLCFTGDGSTDSNVQRYRDQLFVLYIYMRQIVERNEDIDQLCNKCVFDGPYLYNKLLHQMHEYISYRIEVINLNSLAVDTLVSRYRQLAHTANLYMLISSKTNIRVELSNDMKRSLKLSIKREKMQQSEYILANTSRPIELLNGGANGTIATNVLHNLSKPVSVSETNETPPEDNESYDVNEKCDFIIRSRFKSKNLCTELLADQKCVYVASCNPGDVVVRQLIAYNSQNLLQNISAAHFTDLEFVHESVKRPSVANQHNSIKCSLMPRGATRFISYYNMGSLSSAGRTLNICSRNTVTFFLDYEGIASVFQTWLFEAYQRICLILFGVHPPRTCMLHSQEECPLCTRVLLVNEVRISLSLFSCCFVFKTKRT